MVQLYSVKDINMIGCLASCYYLIVLLLLFIIIFVIAVESMAGFQSSVKAA